LQGTYVSNNNQGYSQYVVKKDDSLYKIAKDHNTTVEELIKINHLPSNTIYLNQILFIPSSQNVGSSNNTYLTKEGETIGDVLNKFKISMRSLDEYNDLDKLKLKSNQLLYVGNLNQTFVITNNTNIEDILNKYNLTALEFLKLNEDKILTLGKEYIVKKLS